MTETRDVDVSKVKSSLTEAMEGTVGVKNPPAEVLDGALQVARDAAELLRSADGGLDEATFAALAEDLPADLRAWLLELPSFLSKKEREEQGDELCDTYAPLFGAGYLEAERAVVRLEAGRKDDALDHISSCEKQYPEHPWVLLRGAFVTERTGNQRAAERRYEAALERARELGDKRDLRFAYDAVVQFHQERNNTARAAEVSRQMIEDLPEIEEEFRTEQIVNDTPKVGRNDPCPCGSGKKFKKCCA